MFYTILHTPDNQKVIHQFHLECIHSELFGDPTRQANIKV